MVVIKCVLKSFLNKVFIENLLIEIEFFKKLKYENIVRFEDF